MIKKILSYARGFGAFSAGMLIGIIYGSIVATLVCVGMLGLP